MKRYLSSPFFLIALLCFLLPFFAVTCAAGGGIPGFGGGGQALTEVSGLDLVTGGAEEDLGDPSEFQPDLGPFAGPTPIPTLSPGAPGAEPVDLGMSQIWAIAAAAVALLGIFLSLLGGRAGGVIALILGAAGAVLLFLLANSVKSSIDDAVGQEAAGFIAVENRIGFWLTLAGFIVAAVTGLIRLLLPPDRLAGAPAAGPAGFDQPPAPPTPPPETSMKDLRETAMRDPDIRRAADETADSLIRNNPKLQKAVEEADRLIAAGRTEEAEALIKRAMEDL